MTQAARAGITFLEKFLRGWWKASRLGGWQRSCREEKTGDDRAGSAGLASDPTKFRSYVVQVPFITRSFAVHPPGKNVANADIRDNRDRPDIRHVNAKARIMPSYAYPGGSSSMRMKINANPTQILSQT
jgi:hypothetical protein